jgi:ADP-ribose pyrophosphatase YjhB (NUDIX family)
MLPSSSNSLDSPAQLRMLVSNFRPTLVNSMQVVSSSVEGTGDTSVTPAKSDTSSSASSDASAYFDCISPTSSEVAAELLKREECFPLDLDLVEAFREHPYTTNTVMPPLKDEDFSIDALQSISRQARAHLMELTVSRTGREQQRWGYAGDDNSNGANIPNCRFTTGCIPILPGGRILLISSTKSQNVFVLPKGGWEHDESLPLSALRETLEEAGVTGLLGPPLPAMTYETKKAVKIRLSKENAAATGPQAPHLNTSDPPVAVYHTHNRLIIFPMYVQSIYDRWPEENRRRRAVTMEQATEMLQHRPEFLQMLRVLQERGMHRLSAT